MRIGILTFHRCINYGSYWQTRCLVEGLRARGHEPVVLDHASRRVDIAEWKCAFRPTLPHPTPREDRPRYRAKIRRFFDAIAALPLAPPIPLREAADGADACAPDCDLVIVGSDEVWNLSHPWYGRYPLFYGDGLRARRLVSYAASFGSHEPWYGLDPDWARRLGRFDRISVRDEGSGEIVERATGARPPLVLDPCLQFPLETPGDAEAPPDGPYLAVYGHGFSPAFVARVRRWARARGLATSSIGYRNDWADRQWLEAGPDEFAGFIAGAAAVATNFFHGCVFALRHGKPFVCEESRYRSNKVRGLMATVGGQPHLQPEGAPDDTLEALLDAPPAPAVGARIEQVREVSRRFLDRALAA